jgi:hypothetical protein
LERRAPPLACAQVGGKARDAEKAKSKARRRHERGNPHGNRHRTRHLLNQEFMEALLLNFRHQGKKAIEWQLAPRG